MSTDFESCLESDAGGSLVYLPTLHYEMAKANGGRKTRFARNVESRRRCAKVLMDLGESMDLFTALTLTRFHEACQRIKNLVISEDFEKSG